MNYASVLLVAWGASAPAWATIGKGSVGDMSKNITTDSLILRPICPGLQTISTQYTNDALLDRGRHAQRH